MGKTGIVKPHWGENPARTNLEGRKSGDHTQTLGGDLTKSGLVMQLQNTCQIPLISLGSRGKNRLLERTEESEDPSKVNMEKGYKSTREDNPAIDQPGS